MMVAFENTEGKEVSIENSIVKDIRIDFLKGKIITEIRVSEDKTMIEFILPNDKMVLMYHEQDCCEDVHIDDIIGDLNVLLNRTILLAELITNKFEEIEDECGSTTWSFYTLGTEKGVVTFRWCGSSNGYYSKEVDLLYFDKIVYEE